MSGTWAGREILAECPAADAWSVLRLLVTGVAVITTGGGPATRGTTVSSVAIASRTPPFITVCMRPESAGLMQLKDEVLFTVNLLAQGQASLAGHFAAPGRATGLRSPSGTAWRHDVASGPALRGAAGWLDCRAERVIPVGDHELVIARVCAAVPGSGVPLAQQGGVLR